LPDGQLSLKFHLNFSTRGSESRLGTDPKFSIF
jgi:hypothetical protein